ncbi:CelD/BcsL family acetyltransferase involved in cellulose biosynthesis [Humitalea rosea]|uniref:CelD/BcsL family acetyltransferase involved in cellulose biosynthesis n=1 Tax=Humitalea rosea TaxID=990373 RepID=A0A2W7J6E5_9PROT|nr:GNAT family N-acetyltransferase [Humitalea rosea]PZW46772.1 CelD/BcsL family acetyltransferase involved in cellulose biosynthesis [Humitalea rosea]
MTVRIYSTPVRSFEELGADWRALEAEVPGRSFFQSWSWVGCLAEERYPDPVLLRAEAEGRTLGLALFNRRQGRLCLAESGDAALDAPFIEHNAPLSLGDDIRRGLLRAAWGVAGARRLVLSGVAPEVLHAAGGTALRLQARPAPLVDLGAVRTAGGDYLATRSANTRYQLRRSARFYAAGGEVLLQRAADAAEALDWFDALLRLHESTWRERGGAGAFATPFLQRFHRSLIAQGASRGEVDMLRVTAGEQEVGYLYNLRLAGRVFAYQSGLDHAGAGTHGKPGLTCHAMAVQRALEMGDAIYDFLAGADQYKRSLATGSEPMVWAELLPVWSPLGMAARLRRLVLR